ncbi:hypothetical protein B188_14060 [Candidatus Brocadiaceae bacterium B188]|nr:hypothetical protein B188_14060 [Candidatus Brocadiaceae bacterium B188]
MPGTSSWVLNLQGQAPNRILLRSVLCQDSIVITLRCDLGVDV